MDVKTLSHILGHYSVSFTLDTYAHVLDDHKKEEMDKLSDLYFESPQGADSFAVIVSCEKGIFTAKSADFTDITVNCSDMNTALNDIKNLIQARLYVEDLYTSVDVSDIETNSDEFIVVVKL
jgi:hypothetical protein